MREVLILTVLIVLCAGLPAFADPFSLNSSSGIWSSVTPAANATGVGTNMLRWGTPQGGGQSGYDYTGSTPPPLLLSTETRFLVGTFVHHNQPITGNTITGATLDITLNMTFGATVVVDTFTYDFEHTETPNAAPCQFPLAPNLVPCDDRVRILNDIPATTFVIGGNTYTLDLVGFSLDGGTTVSDIFYTEEGLNNTAALYGVVTSNFTSMPEPASILLLATCAGLCLKRLLRR